MAGWQDKHLSQKDFESLSTILQSTPRGCGRGPKIEIDTTHPATYLLMMCVFPMHEWPWAKLKLSEKRETITSHHTIPKKRKA